MNGQVMKRVNIPHEEYLKVRWNWTHKAIYASTLSEPRKKKMEVIKELENVKYCT